MRLSLNEIEVTVRKAALGAGLPLGLAEEAGAACVWLAAAGLPVAELARAALDGAASTELRLVRSPGMTRLLAHGGALSTLAAAPSACDLVVSDAQAPPAVLRMVLDVPALALGQAAVATQRSGLSLCLTAGGVAWGFAAGLAPAGRPEMNRLATLRSCQVTLSRAADAGQPMLSPPAATAHSGVEVDAAQWRVVQALADRMLVSATRHSREHGAGAGLIDTD
jgi:hypothetical protein